MAIRWGRSDLYAGMAAWILSGVMASSSAAATLVHQPIMDAPAGQPLAVQATVVDGSDKIQQVRLYYRQNGALGYRLELMRRSGFVYTAQIPGSMLLAQGLEYYIEAQTQSGLTFTSPALNARTVPHKVVVRSSAGPAPGFELLSPENGATVLPENAVVVVALDAGPSQIDPNTIRVYFDEQDVTRQAKLSPTLLSYVPRDDIAEGMHGVRVEAENVDGILGRSPTWSFNVSQQAAVGEAETPVQPTPTPAFQLQGSVNAESQYALVTRKSENEAVLSQPKGFLNRLNLNLKGRAGELDLLGTAYLTSEETPGQQPVNRFRFDLSHPTFDLALGDFYPEFSDFTLNDTLVRGGRLMLTSGRITDTYSQLQVLGGLSLYPLEGRELEGGAVIEADGTFERWLLGTRWNYNLLPGTGWALNYCTLNDYANSITQPGTTNPSNNHVASGQMQIELHLSPELSSSVYGEYGLSYFDEAQLLTSLSLGDAYRLGNRWSWGGRSFIQAEYRRVGSNYVSLANPWLSGDWNGIQGDLQMYFLNDDLSFLMETEIWHDNLNDQKTVEYYSDAAGTTVTTGTVYAQLISGMINYRISPLIPNLSLGISQSREQDNTQPRSIVDNQTLVWNSAVGLMIPMGQHSWMTNLSYTQSRYQDLANEKISADVNNSAFLLSGMFLWGEAWTLSAGFGLTQNQTDYSQLPPDMFTTAPTRQTIDYGLWNVGVVWKVLPARLQLGLNWESLHGRDDQNLVDNQLTTLALSGTYYLASQHSIGLTVSAIDYQASRPHDDSTQEWVFNLTYAIQF